MVRRSCRDDAEKQEEKKGGNLQLANKILVSCAA